MDRKGNENVKSYIQVSQIDITKGDRCLYVCRKAFISKHEEKEGEKDR
jgi:hypothetical protein